MTEAVRHPGDPLLVPTPEGLFCPAGGFHVDPVRPVARAVLTHAHADHARPGSESYLATPESEGVLRHRLGRGIALRTLPYGEGCRLGAVQVSLHPAGHVLGSAQVRIAGPESTWVISGDFKRAPDPTTRPFERVPCDVFVTESTFALPVYRWPAAEEVMEELLAFWHRTVAERRPLVLFVYAFGKAQRVLAGLRAYRHPGPILLHGAVASLTRLYREEGIPLPPTRPVSEIPRGEDLGGALVLAPPSAQGSPWMRRFPKARTAFASGWMQVRGRRRQRGVDRGFILSDHADWEGLVDTARATGAREVLCMHGRALTLARYLRETGLEARAFGGPPRRGEGAP